MVLEVQCFETGVWQGDLQECTRSIMPSRTETLAGERCAHEVVALMRAAEEGKREGNKDIFTGDSMRPLHMNGRTEAAAAAASDDVWSIIITTAAATAGAPRKRNAASTAADACIAPRAHVSICSCCAADTDANRPSIRRTLCDV